MMQGSVHPWGLGASRGYDRPVSRNVLRGAVRCPETNLIGSPFASRSTTHRVNFDDATRRESDSTPSAQPPAYTRASHFVLRRGRLGSDKTQLKLHGWIVQK